MISYEKLNGILEEKGLMRKDLIEAKVVSGTTLAKINDEGEPISTKTIDKICKFLNVQPGDFMEYKEEKNEEQRERIYKRSKAKSKKDWERFQQRMKE